MTTREQLHGLVDRLPDAELETAKRYLEAIESARGIPQSLTEAAEETEPLAPEDAAALAEAEAQVARGEIIPDTQFDEVLARARRDRRRNR